MNNVINKMQSLDVNDILISWEIKMGALSREEIISLAVLAAVGFLFCILGLKIIRAWAAAAGFLIGFVFGAAAAFYLHVGGTAILIVGGIVGLIFAFLSAFFYRVGVFITVFLSVCGIYIQIVQPADYISLCIGLAVALLFAVLAVKFVVVLTILATSLWGALLAGTAVYQLTPLEGMVFSILFCLVFAVFGIIIQLLLESRKRKRKSLEKAAEIRDAHSAENEIEKARSFIDNLDKETGEASEGNDYTMEVVELDGDEEDDEDE